MDKFTLSEKLMLAGVVILGLVMFFGFLFVAQNAIETICK